MIQVRHLNKSFGRTAAVRGVSFDAPDASITGLLGRNGAGKTTTLRMVAGVLAPSSGSITLGRPSTHQTREARQAQLGALLDHHGLYGRLTAREHLTYFGRLRRLSAARLAVRIEDLLSILALTSLADRRVGGFSQGERMKVALGCALIHDPTHLLLDEATNGLDVPTVRALRTLLKDLRDRGTCIVFSSHVLGEVEALCDRIVIVDSGAVVAEGTPEQLREQAKSQSLEDAFVRLTEIVPC
jgi:sodium transport system ATP-binding protein